MGEDNLTPIHITQLRRTIHHTSPPLCTSFSTLSVTYAMMHSPMST
jgi:hypothetical protein